MRIMLLCLMLCLAACSAPAPAAPPPTPFPFETILPPDAIRTLDHPDTVDAEQAAAHIGPLEEVMGVALGGEARAYPLGLMRRHEIANDTVGGQPITVTFCPTCNSGIVISRQVEGANGPTELTFGVSGKHLDGALVMSAGGSLWPQSRLVAIGGEWEGTTLKLLPASQMTWQEWANTHPDTTLVIEESTLPTPPRDFSMSGLTGTSRTPAVTGYVLGMASEQAALAVPLATIEAQGLVNSEAAGLPPVVLISLGQPGHVAAWERTHEGQPLTFYWEQEKLYDRETGSVWSPDSGVALSGPLAQAQLTPASVLLVHWLGWKDLYPSTTVWE